MKKCDYCETTILFCSFPIEGYTAYSMYMWYTQEERSPAVWCVATRQCAIFIKYEGATHPTD
ncbi:hypothetical protein QT987_18160 [Microcoleus sp. SVA1B4]